MSKEPCDCPKDKDGECIPMTELEKMEIGHKVMKNSYIAQIKNLNKIALFERRENEKLKELKNCGAMDMIEKLNEPLWYNIEHEKYYTIRRLREDDTFI